MRKTRFREPQKDIAGFTIVELLIALTVFSVLAAAITPIFKQGNEYLQITQSRTELRQSLNSALQLMAGELREADPGTIDASEALPENANGDIPIVQYTVTSGAGAAKRSFSLPKSGRKHLNFNKGEKSVSITPTTSIEIIAATVENQAGQGQPPLYKITVQGEYRLPNAVHSDDRRLTVQAFVAPRAEPGAER